MTEKLYELDSYCRSFAAVVEECRPMDGGYMVRLDRTAFFPEGGGQAADTGRLGDAAVLDVQIVDGEIWHYTDKPLVTEESVQGALDWTVRFSRMQHHTAEHIICGLAHRHYGYENVGFHLGSEDVTLDLSGELTREQLDALEEEANAIVHANVAVTAAIPDPAQLAQITYRSKKEKELTGPVRLVTIDGVDCCACCAPHVARTGEIGVIKLLDFLRYKGGVRIHLLCGAAALVDYRLRYTQTAAAAAAMSVKQVDFTPAFARLVAERDSLRLALKESHRRIADLQAAAVEPTDRPVYLLGADWDAETLRRIVNRLSERCGGICAAFSGEDGAYQYVVGGKADLPAFGKRLNAALNGRGGGSPRQIQGRVQATAKEIEAFFAELSAAE
ncbi:MAG: alanyl-tRNA editing protein [Clostridia bacterium]|nr:alanyl-tRNA editing protein [Clostridia bacterium]